jgi:3-oxoacyl-[acyl-carrier-protein] synthase-3
MRINYLIHLLFLSFKGTHMKKTKIAGVGMYVPSKVVTNHDLTKYMDTSDEWITERTGIKERRYAHRTEETTTTMAVEASRQAIERAGVTPNDIDFIIFATLSPDYYFPGCGVLLQRALNITTEIGALDVRNQCSGFLYGLSVADQFIKSGMYKNILLVGSEKHSFGLDFSTRGRAITAIFGDGAGAVVLQPTEEEGKGILSTHLHSDGLQAEELAMFNPGTHANHWVQEPVADFDDAEIANMFMSHQMIDKAQNFPVMNGQAVFKRAIVKFPEVIHEALNHNGYTPGDLDLLIPHQANLRISQHVQKVLGLNDDQVFNNIQKFGNTTAASVPIALCEAWEEGRVKPGNLICLAAFGSGFTWGSALIRW